MYCGKCGKQLEEDEKYCTTCGGAVNIHENNHMEKLKDKKVIGLGITIIAVCILLFVGIKGQDVNRSPLSVTKGVFEATDAQNVDQVIECCGLEYPGEHYRLTESERRELAQMLRDGDKNLEKSLGKNWSKKIKYELMENDEVRAELDGDYMYVSPIKIEGKYYLDFEEIF